MFFRNFESRTVEPWLYSIRRWGYNRAQSDFAVTRTSKYPYCNIHYVEEGRVEITFDQKKFSAQEGDYFILPPFMAHSYSVISDKGAVLRWLEYDGSDSEALSNRILRLNGSVVVTAVCGSKVTFDMALKLCCDKESVYDRSKALYGLLVDQLACLSDGCALNTSKEHDPLDTITAYIDQHLDQDLKVSDLAQYYGYSTSYMIKMFKKRYDMTPGAYIYDRRLGKVKHLLLNDDLPLELISQRCGFYDAAHLIRRFKQNEGMTPMTYKSEVDQYKLKT